MTRSRRRRQIARRNNANRGTTTSQSRGSNFVPHQTRSPPSWYDRNQDLEDHIPPPEYIHLLAFALALGADPYDVDEEEEDFIRLMDNLELSSEGEDSNNGEEELWEDYSEQIEESPEKLTFQWKLARAIDAKRDIVLGMKINPCFFLASKKQSTRGDNYIIHRAFHLPSNVDLTRIKATCVDQKLNITFAKEQNNKAFREIPIE
ncbi:hypothetical protein EC973_001289 [Apophysomyces ossiformis]|uniref:SHSP domain-containing protein n=1 Tax=Apophysomyces ossiformis TaxID=679940 RepID=A0A8H7BQ57_9FUNG|nr:hypothetical protein EC973_001289 [Apophysomyces ossiformis]